MTKKRFEIDMENNKKDIITAIGYINSVLNKFSELLLYYLKKDKYFNKLNPKLKQDLSVIDLFLKYKKGKEPLKLYLVISKSFVYLTNDITDFNKNSSYYSVDIFSFVTDFEKHLKQLKTVIELIRQNYRDLAF